MQNPANASLSPSIGESAATLPMEQKRGDGCKILREPPLRKRPSFAYTMTGGGEKQMPGRDRGEATKAEIMINCFSEKVHEFPQEMEEAGQGENSGRNLNFLKTRDNSMNWTFRELLHRQTDFQRIGSGSLILAYSRRPESQKSEAVNSCTRSREGASPV